jgi:hypothetical protein
MWMTQFLILFPHLLDVIFWVKPNTTIWVKNTVLYIVPFRTSSNLWIPSTNQRIEIKHFSCYFCIWFDRDNHHATKPRLSHRDNTRVPSFVTSDHPFKVGRLVYHQYSQKKPQIWHSFAVLVDWWGMRNPTLMGFIELNFGEGSTGTAPFQFGRGDQALCKNRSWRWGLCDQR